METEEFTNNDINFNLDFGVYTDSVQYEFDTYSGDKKNQILYKDSTIYDLYNFVNQSLLDKGYTSKFFVCLYIYNKEFLIIELKKLFKSLFVSEDIVKGDLLLDYIKLFGYNKDFCESLERYFNEYNNILNFEVFNDILKIETQKNNFNKEIILGYEFFDINYNIYLNIGINDEDFNRFNPENININKLFSLNNFNKQLTSYFHLSNNLMLKIYFFEDLIEKESILKLIKIHHYFNYNDSDVDKPINGGLYLYKQIDYNNIYNEKNFELFKASDTIEHFKFITIKNIDLLIYNYNIKIIPNFNYVIKKINLTIYDNIKFIAFYTSNDNINFKFKKQDEDRLYSKRKDLEEFINNIGSDFDGKTGKIILFKIVEKGNLYNIYLFENGDIEISLNNIKLNDIIELLNKLLSDIKQILISNNIINDTDFNLLINDQTKFFSNIYDLNKNIENKLISIGPQNRFSTNVNIKHVIINKNELNKYFIKFYSHFFVNTKYNNDLFFYKKSPSFLTFDIFLNFIKNYHYENIKYFKDNDPANIQRKLTRQFPKYANLSGIYKYPDRDTKNGYDEFNEIINNSIMNDKKFNIPANLEGISLLRYDDKENTQYKYIDRVGVTKYIEEKNLNSEEISILNSYLYLKKYYQQYVDNNEKNKNNFKKILKYIYKQCYFKFVIQTNNLYCDIYNISNFFELYYITKYIHDINSNFINRIEITTEDEQNIILDYVKKSNTIISFSNNPVYTNGYPFSNYYYDNNGFVKNKNNNSITNIIRTPSSKITLSKKEEISYKIYKDAYMNTKPDDIVGKLIIGLNEADTSTEKFLVEYKTYNYPINIFNNYLYYINIIKKIYQEILNLYTKLDGDLGVLDVSRLPTPDAEYEMNYLINKFDKFNVFYKKDLKAKYSGINVEHYPIAIDKELFNEFINQEITFDVEQYNKILPDLFYNDSKLLGLESKQKVNITTVYSPVVKYAKIDEPVDIDPKKDTFLGYFYQSYYDLEIELGNEFYNKPTSPVINFNETEKLYKYFIDNIENNVNFIIENFEEYNNFKNIYNFLKDQLFYFILKKPSEIWITRNDIMMRSKERFTNKSGIKFHDKFSPKIKFLNEYLQHEDSKIDNDTIKSIIGNLSEENYGVLIRKLCILPILYKKFNLLKNDGKKDEEAINYIIKTPEDILKFSLELSGELNTKFDDYTYNFLIIHGPKNTVTNEEELNNFLKDTFLNDQKVNKVMSEIYKKEEIKMEQIKTLIANKQKAEAELTAAEASRDVEAKERALRDVKEATEILSKKRKEWVEFKESLGLTKQGDYSAWLRIKSDYNPFLYISKDEYIKLLNKIENETFENEIKNYYEYLNTFELEDAIKHLQEEFNTYDKLLSLYKSCTIINSLLYRYTTHIEEDIIYETSFNKIINHFKLYQEYLNIKSQFNLLSPELVVDGNKFKNYLTLENKDSKFNCQGAEWLPGPGKFVDDNHRIIDYDDKYWMCVANTKARKKEKEETDKDKKRVLKYCPAWIPPIRRDSTGLIWCKQQRALNKSDNHHYLEILSHHTGILDDQKYTYKNLSNFEHNKGKRLYNDDNKKIKSMFYNDSNNDTINFYTIGNIVNSDVSRFFNTYIYSLFYVLNHHKIIKSEKFNNSLLKEQLEEAKKKAKKKEDENYNTIYLDSNMGEIWNAFLNDIENNFSIRNKSERPSDFDANYFGELYQNKILNVLFYDEIQEFKEQLESNKLTISDGVIKYEDLEIQIENDEMSQYNVNNVVNNFIYERFIKYLKDNKTNINDNILLELFIKLYNINIIIFEILEHNYETQSMEIKCPINSNINNLYNFQDEAENILILQYYDIYQLIVQYSNSKEFTIIFKFNDVFEYIIKQCKFKNNDYKFNYALINSIYHSLPKKRIEKYDYLTYNDIDLIINKTNLTIENELYVNKFNQVIGFIIKLLDDNKQVIQQFIPFNYLKNDIYNFYSHITTFSKIIIEDFTDLEDKIIKNKDITHTLDKTIDNLKKINEVINIITQQEWNKFAFANKFLLNDVDIIGIFINTNDIIYVNESTTDSEIEHKKITDTKLDKYIELVDIQEINIEDYHLKFQIPVDESESNPNIDNYEVYEKDYYLLYQLFVRTISKFFNETHIEENIEEYVDKLIGEIIKIVNQKTQENFIKLVYYSYVNDDWDKIKILFLTENLKNEIKNLFLTQYNNNFVFRNLINNKEIEDKYEEDTNVFYGNRKNFTKNGKSGEIASYKLDKYLNEIYTNFISNNELYISGVNIDRTHITFNHNLCNNSIPLVEWFVDRLELSKKSQELQELSGPLRDSFQKQQHFNQQLEKLNEYYLYTFKGYDNIHAYNKCIFYHLYIKIKLLQIDNKPDTFDNFYNRFIDTLYHNNSDISIKEKGILTFIEYYIEENNSLLFYNLANEMYSLDKEKLKQSSADFLPYFKEIIRNKHWITLLDLKILSACYSSDNKHLVFNIIDVYNEDFNRIYYRDTIPSNDVNNIYLVKDKIYYKNVFYLILHEREKESFDNEIKQFENKEVNNLPTRDSDIFSRDPSQPPSPQHSRDPSPSPSRDTSPRSSPPLLTIHRVEENRVEEFKEYKVILSGLHSELLSEYKQFQQQYSELYNQYLGLEAIIKDPSPEQGVIDLYKSNLIQLVKELNTINKTINNYAKLKQYVELYTKVMEEYEDFKDSEFTQIHFKTLFSFDNKQGQENNSLFNLLQINIREFEKLLINKMSVIFLKNSNFKEKNVHEVIDHIFSDTDLLDYRINSLNDLIEKGLSDELIEFKDLEKFIDISDIIPYFRNDIVEQFKNLTFETHNQEGGLIKKDKFNKMWNVGRGDCFYHSIIQGIMYILGDAVVTYQSTNEELRDSDVQYLQREWNCSQCTYLNFEMAKNCRMCNAPRLHEADFAEIPVTEEGEETTEQKKLVLEKFINFKEEFIANRKRIESKLLSYYDIENESSLLLLHRLLHKFLRDILVLITDYDYIQNINDSTTNKKINLYSNESLFNYHKILADDLDVFNDENTLIGASTLELVDDKLVSINNIDKELLLRTPPDIILPVINNKYLKSYQNKYKSQNAAWATWSELRLTSFILNLDIFLFGESNEDDKYQLVKIIYSPHKNSISINLYMNASGLNIYNANHYQLLIPVVSDSEQSSDQADISASPSATSASPSDPLDTSGLLATSDPASATLDQAESSEPAKAESSGLTAISATSDTSANAESSGLSDLASDTSVLSDPLATDSAAISNQADIDPKIRIDDHLHRHTLMKKKMYHSHSHKHDDDEDKHKKIHNITSLKQFKDHIDGKDHNFKLIHKSESEESDVNAEKHRKNEEHNPQKYSDAQLNDVIGAKYKLSE